jgi:hypothetical protein
MHGAAPLRPTSRTTPAASSFLLGHKPLSHALKVPASDWAPLATTRSLPVISTPHPSRRSRTSRCSRRPNRSFSTTSGASPSDSSSATVIRRLARLSPRCLTTRQASLALRTAQLLPLKGLSTLGADRARFQARQAAWYRAPWRLPEPDFHRHPATSFRSGHDRWTITTVISGRTDCRTSGTQSRHRR